MATSTLRIVNCSIQLLALILLIVGMAVVYFKLNMNNGNTQNTHQLNNGGSSFPSGGSSFPSGGSFPSGINRRKRAGELENTFKAVNQELSYSLFKGEAKGEVKGIRACVCLALISILVTLVLNAVPFFLSKFYIKALITQAALMLAAAVFLLIVVIVSAVYVTSTMKNMLKLDAGFYVIIISMITSLVASGITMLEYRAAQKESLSPRV